MTNSGKSERGRIDPVISPEGEQREAKYRKDFAEQLRQVARQCAVRRGASNSLDESDFDAAYRHLLSSARDDKWDRIRKIVANLAVFGSGACLPLGVQLVAKPLAQGDPSYTVTGVALILISVVAAVLAAILHEVRVFRQP